MVAAARLKVLASLPSELRTRASRLVERFHLDAAGWFQAGEPVPHLTAISDAVWESRRLRIVYSRGGDTTVERLIDPLGVVLKGGVWYLVATSEDQTRTYRISRVVDAETLAERFERPNRFDLATYWTEASAAYEQNTPRVDVLVRVDRRGLVDLTTAVGERVVAAADQLADPEEGWSRLRLRLDWPDEAAGRLLGVGPGLEVLEPPDIRRRVIALARAVVERYPDPLRVGAGLTSLLSARSERRRRTASISRRRSACMVRASSRDIIVSTSLGPIGRSRHSRVPRYRGYMTGRVI